MSDIGQSRGYNKVLDKADGEPKAQNKKLEKA